MALTKTAYRMISSAPLSILDFGAKLDGVTDDTNAWNAALATGKVVYFPEGKSLIRNRLTMAAVFGAAIIGSGRETSQFIINFGSFNMAATAVIRIGAVYQCIRGVGFIFSQPTTTIRNNVKKYPAVIDCDGHARTEVSNIRVEGAWIGIRAQGNCGGAVFDDIQMGAFFQGLVIDGALDSIRLNRYHFWPFGFAGDAGLFGIYSDGGTTSMNIGRCDDFNMSSILSFRGRIIFADNGSGGPFGVGSDITLDSDYGRIEFGAGEMVLSSVYGSTAAGNDFIVHVTGGELKIAGLAMEAAVDLSQPMVKVSGLGVLVVSDVLATVTGPATRAFRQEGGTMMVNNGMFIATQGQTRTSALIEIAAGRATLTCLRTNDKGAGTGGFITVGQDDFHVIANNAAPGFTYAFPATRPVGIYTPNI